MQDVNLVDITPDVAREWLGFNTHNRNVRQRVVLAYAADMTAGNWRWNGESIKFASDGTLLDGQHRLAAIAEADVTIPMLVVRGLKNDAQETVDGGAKRRFSDVLKLRGEQYPTTLAATCRRVTAWEGGARRADSLKYVPTNAQMLQTLEKYPWLRDIAAGAENCSRKSGMPGSVVGLCWFLFSQVEGPEDDDAQFFFARLADFQGLAKGDPIYELRHAVEAGQNVRGQRSQAFLTAITIKAWNAYRDGTKIHQLSFKSGGSKPERFPEPH